MNEFEEALAEVLRAADKAGLGADDDLLRRLERFKFEVVLFQNYFLIQRMVAEAG